MAQPEVASKLPPPLNSYAAVLETIGISGFFSGMEQKLNPAQRWNRQFKPTITMSFARAMAYMKEQCNASHTIAFHQGTGWAQLPAATQGREDLRSTAGPDGAKNASEGCCRGASLDWLRKRLVHGHTVDLEVRGFTDYAHGRGLGQAVQLGARAFGCANYGGEHDAYPPGFPIWPWYFYPSDSSSRLDFRGFRTRHPARMGGIQRVNYKPSHFSSHSTGF